MAQVDAIEGAAAGGEKPRKALLPGFFEGRGLPRHIRIGRGHSASPLPALALTFFLPAWHFEASFH
jgi:hypothetical protein